MGGGTSTQVIQPNSPQGPSNGSGGSSDAIELLQDIDSVLEGALGEGEGQIQIDVLTMNSGGAFQQLYQNHLKVKSVIIQNLTTQTSSVVTLTSSRGTSNGQGGSPGQGGLLNPAGTAGQGGGSYSDGNVDLFWYWWSSVNTSDQIVVIYRT